MFREKIITKHWNEISPLKIGDYLEVGGYKALRKFIRGENREEAVEEIKKSGLCGRGGAGFPIGKKLEAVFKNGQKQKYFICNLDESESGTYKDRSIAGNNPHLLLEGIILLSLICGAKQAYIYINGNFKKETEILEKALEDSREKNFWGERILNSEYFLNIELFSGAGAYICGEETALINSLEGNRGEPLFRPPYPVDRGLFGKPTLVNNAETVSCIPWIISNGGAKFSKIGSKNSPGTKLYCIGGAVKNPGIYEAPTGISLKQAIFELAGGMFRGKDFWFAQVGGSSGGLFLEKELKQKLDYKNDGKKKFIPMGSGAILVVDRTVDLRDLLLSWAGFFRRESCGKCIPCREGTFRLWEIFKRFRDGEISKRDKEAVSDILWTLENTTFCPLGKFAATAFRDAIEKLKFLKSTVYGNKNKPKKV